METTRMAGHLIRRLNQQSTQVFQARMKAEGFDLTSVQFAALSALANNPGIDQARLSALIAYDRATIGGVVDRLEQKGLVARSVSDKDRRARVLTLTETGENRLAVMTPVVEDLQADILNRLDPGERAAFVALARRALGENDEMDPA
ncbi:MarR family winged helix-turn-helix transcriptional regulator [Maritimibacter sp. UBA3975]|uniref:MarR family winged helix-turn-helix transcriptional regulator n=1 Tax=Maritimibacter sp. UBA3975 TaxID=1946833 RepID=UPI000C097C51|nr:MarR family winged helix-turn-helix transcriptional regulator [Maritimibacter sp. UBA3975]MAM60356.1 MarR family transcriptional regulator [Maritimibacter sp.]|tara:strand:+ start:4051 stop:4491 length:441 start_codon:yes stop_codon:yes gene_type:complete